MTTKHGHPEFRTYALTTEGAAKSEQITAAFNRLLDELTDLVPPGRQLALVKTELERASFHAKKGMAEANAMPEAEVAP